MRAMQEAQALPSPPGESPLVSKTGEIPELPPPSPQSLANLVPGSCSNLGPHDITLETAAKALEMRLKHYSFAQIAKELGITRTQVSYALAVIRRQGRLPDVLELIDNIAVPQAVENIVEALSTEKRDGVEGERWWEATKKVLEGRGVHRKWSHNKNAGEGGPSVPPLQINIINQDGGPPPTVIVNSEKGSIIGAARED